MEVRNVQWEIEYRIGGDVATLSDLVVQKILTEMAMAMMPRMMEKLI